MVRFERFILSLIVVGFVLVLITALNTPILFAQSEKDPSKKPDYEKVIQKDATQIAKEQLSIRLEESISGLGDVLYLEAPMLLKCRIVKPKNFDPNKTYPLVIGLHGYSSNPERFIYLWNSLEQPDIIYAVPQGPYAIPEGPILGYSWSIWDVEDQDLLPKSVELTQKYLLHLTHGLKQHYKIDKTYLLGFSQGAAFAFMTALTNPQDYDGVISLGGWLPREQFTDEQLQNANNLKVFFGHGKSDEAVSLGLAEHSRKVLDSFKYKTTFESFTGGHEIPAELLKQVVKWIQLSENLK